MTLQDIVVLYQTPQFSQSPWSSRPPSPPAAASKAWPPPANSNLIFRRLCCFDIAKNIELVKIFHLGNAFAATALFSQNHIILGLVPLRHCTTETFLKIIPLYMYRIIPLLQCTQCIRYRGILYTIPLYLEFKINIFLIFWQVSGVKSNLIRFLDFLDFFKFLDD